jgi:hypothetical protein
MMDKKIEYKFFETSHTSLITEITEYSISTDINTSKIVNETT